jgi:hypothetical protein
MTDAGDPSSAGVLPEEGIPPEGNHMATDVRFSGVDVEHGLGSRDPEGAALRQMRRRYDTLRRDYEDLLDRLGELEERLSEPEPARAPTPRDPGVWGTISEGLAAPLLRLREEYLDAASQVQRIVAGLDSLASGTFKGQHAATPEAPPEAATTAESSPDERPPGRPRTVEVTVEGGDFGELLDFQEQLSGLARVARVSISRVDNERATLLVELSPDR